MHKISGVRILSGQHIQIFQKNSYKNQLPLSFIHNHAPCPLVWKFLGFTPNSMIYHPKKQNPSVKHQGNFSLTSRKKDQICQTSTEKKEFYFPM